MNIDLDEDGFYIARFSKDGFVICVNSEINFEFDKTGMSIDRLESLNSGNWYPLRIAASVYRLGVELVTNVEIGAATDDSRHRIELMVNRVADKAISLAKLKLAELAATVECPHCKARCPACREEGPPGRDGHREKSP